VLTSQSRRAGLVMAGWVMAGWVMACWQRNWQFTQPPAAARRRRVDMRVAKTSAAATAAPAVATVTAATRAAVSKKWLTGLEKTSQATTMMAASPLAGRA
jgi:hypothetical protein